jgi:hypothetical protein
MRGPVPSCALPCLLASLLASLLFGGAARGDDAGFAWRPLDGWKSETIPFPLPFAPRLAHRGSEALRFMPGFFDPSSTGFWSYAFVWWTEDAAALERAAVESELAEYFAGLSNEVGGKKYRFDPKRFRARLTADGARWSGTVDSYDAFVTGKELTLHVLVETRACPQAKRRAYLFAASPRPSDDPVWRRLAEQTTLFSCR